VEGGLEGGVAVGVAVGPQLWPMRVDSLKPKLVPNFMDSPSSSRVYPPTPLDDDDVGEGN